MLHYGAVPPLTACPHSASSSGSSPSPHSPSTSHPPQGKRDPTPPSPPTPPHKASDTFKKYEADEGKEAAWKKLMGEIGKMMYDNLKAGKTTHDCWKPLLGADGKMAKYDNPDDWLAAWKKVGVRRPAEGHPAACRPPAGRSVPPRLPASRSSASPVCPTPPACLWRRQENQAVKDSFKAMGEKIKKASK